MRGALVKAGGGRFPDLQVINREGITHVAWEAADVNLDPALIQWAWDATDPSHPRFVPVVQRGAGPMNQLAKDLSDDITRLGGGPAGKPIKIPIGVMPDIEYTHDPADLMQFYRVFRSLRAAREIYLTVEHHQAGWFSDALVDAINRDPRFWILPQAYEHGEMVPVDPRYARDNLESRGVLRSKIQVFLRSDRLDIGWDGWAYAP